MGRTEGVITGNAIRRLVKMSPLWCYCTCMSTVGGDFAQKIHPSKTKEMIVIDRRSTRAQPPADPITPGAERVEQLRVLGVLLNPQQCLLGDHIDLAVSSSASSKFALRTLWTHGLRPQELHLMARATTIASLQYASPAW